MKQSVAILTHHTNARNLQDLMISLRGCKYPIVIVNNDCRKSPPEFTRYLGSLRSDRVKVIFSERDGWDTQLLQVMMEETTCDEWLFLHDTVVIIDHALLDMCFKGYPGRSVSIFPWYRNFIGKYTRNDLEAFPAPVCSSKRDAFLAEMNWCPEYAKRSNAKRLFLEDGSKDIMMQRMEERYGREVRTIKNDYFIKYKHSWYVPEEWRAELDSGT